MKQKILYGVVFSSIIAMGPLSFAADHDGEVAKSGSSDSAKAKSILSNELSFWAANKVKEGLPELGNFHAVTSVWNVEDLNLDDYRKLKAELLALKPAAQSVKIDKQYNTFTISAEACSLQCLELIQSYKDKLKITQIGMEDGNSLVGDMIKETQFHRDIRAAMASNDKARIGKILRDSTYARFLNLSEIDTLALEKIFAESPSRQEIESDHMSDDVISVILQKQTVSTHIVGGYSSDIRRLEEVQNVMRLQSEQKANLPAPVAEGFKVIKTATFPTYSGHVADYLKIPLNMSAMEYLILKQDIAEYNEKSPTKIKVSFDKAARDPSKPFKIE